MNNHDELEELLGRELHGQVDGMNTAPLGLGDVQGRASSIRRNRRIAVGVGVAAALAVIVPTAVTATDLMRTDSAPPPATSPTPKPGPQPQADGSFPLTIEGLPDGEPAQIGYTLIDEQQLVMPAETFDLPDAYTQIAPYGTDGWLALRSGNYPPTGSQIVELTEDFDVVSSVSAGPAFVLNSDASRFAWVEVEGGQSVLVTAPSDGGEPTRTPIGDDIAQPVGFLPGNRVAFSSTDQANGEQSFGLVAPDGEVTEIGGFLRLYDASEANGLVAGQTQYRRDGTSCAGALANSGMAWETCDHTLGQFSPDGRYVVGLANQFDGPGSPTVSVLDAATGDALVDFRPAKGVFVGVDQVEWEDNDTLLATVTQGSDQALVRLEMNGRVELVDGPFPLSGLEINVRFAEHPVA